MTKFIPLPYTATFNNWTEAMESVQAMVSAANMAADLPVHFYDALVVLRDRLNETAHLNWLDEKEQSESL